MVAETVNQRGFARHVTSRPSAPVWRPRRRWREADHGIWEIRDAPVKHVHSRVMSWLAVDKALEVAHIAESDRPDWVELRDKIKTDVWTNGWDAQLNSFVASYGSQDVDAACLQS